MEEVLSGFGKTGEKWKQVVVDWLKRPDDDTRVLVFDCQMQLIWYNSLATLGIYVAFGRLISKWSPNKVDFSF